MRSGWRIAAGTGDKVWRISLVNDCRRIGCVDVPEHRPFCENERSHRRDGVVVLRIQGIVLDGKGAVRRRCVYNARTSDVVAVAHRKTLELSRCDHDVAVSDKPPVSACDEISLVRENMAVHHDVFQSGIVERLYPRRGAAYRRISRKLHPAQVRGIFRFPPRGGRVRIH